MTFSILDPFRFRRRLKLHVLLFLFLSSPPCSAAEKSSSAWVLEQDHEVYGTYRIYAFPDRLRAENLKNGLVIISSAPDWMVVAFLPSTKKYAVCKPERFKGNLNVTMTLLTGRDFSKMPVTHTGYATTAGIKTCTYKTTRTYEETQARDFKRKEVHFSGVKKAVYQVADAIKVPRQEGEILDRLYGIPKVNGIPIELKYDKLVGGTDVKFLTTRSCKQENVPSALQKLPPGYKQTSSMEALLAESNSGKGGIGMILNEIDQKDGLSPLKGR